MLQLPEPLSASTLKTLDFSAEQINAIIKLMKDVLDQAFDRLDKRLNKCFELQSSQQQSPQQVIAKNSLKSTTKKRKRRR